jgi:hypothetical protein
MLMARLSNREAGVPQAPRAPSLAGGTVFAGQGGGRAWIRFQAAMIAVAQGQDAAIFRVFAAPAVHEPGGGVEEPVAQRLRFCLRELAVQGEEPQPRQQYAGAHGRVQPGLVQPVVTGREMPEAGVLPGTDHVLDPGVDPVACVDVGALAAPAPRVLGQVRRPQGVPPSVGGLEHGELGAGVGPLRRAKTLIFFGQAFSRSPPGPLRRRPVSSVTCASSIQQSRCPHLSFAQAPPERRSRTFPIASIAASHAVSGTSASAVFSRSVSAQPTEYTSSYPRREASLLKSLDSGTPVTGPTAWLSAWLDAENQVRGHFSHVVQAQDSAAWRMRLARGPKAWSISFCDPCPDLAYRPCHYLR